MATYYMACGWHRGYFGMQVNSPTERRIIFSVWDSGGEAVDRSKVGRRKTGSRSSPRAKEFTPATSAMKAPAGTAT